MNRKGQSRLQFIASLVIVTVWRAVPYSFKSHDFITRHSDLYGYKLDCIRTSALVAQSYRLWMLIQCQLDAETCGKWTNSMEYILFLQKLLVSDIIKKFSARLETRRFITVFIKIRHLSPSRARSILSTPSQPISLRSLLILSYHLTPSFFPGGLLSFHRQNPVRSSPFPGTCHMLSPSPWLGKRTFASVFPKHSPSLPA